MVRFPLNSSRSPESQQVRMKLAVIAIVLFWALYSTFTLALQSCSAIKGPVSVTCPADATCEAVDFGDAVVLTVCLSAADMSKLKTLATERRDKLQAQPK